MGRRRVPTEILKLRGSRAVEARGNEPTAPIGIPTPPTFLDAEGRAEWRRSVKLLDSMNLASPAWRGALTVLCEAWSCYANAVKQVKETGGEVVKSPNGFPVKNPFASARDKAAALYLQAVAEFGWTPVAKSRVAAAEKPTAGIRKRNRQSEQTKGTA